MSIQTKTQEQIIQDKYDLLMETIAYRAAYYRENPEKFVYDYLGIELRTFQKILLNQMFKNNFTLYTASRGQGKTFLTAVFICCYCILYPGTIACVASSVRTQGNEVLTKVKDILIPMSDNLRYEIKEISIGQNKAEIVFKNNSKAKVVTAGDTARGNRATLLCVDEFVKVDENIITTVLEKFLTAEREPKFLNKPQYKDYPKERNKQIFLSSAWMKDHWGYRKLQTYAASMVDGRSFFACGLPYQLSIKEKLLNKSQCEDDMVSPDFNQMTWDMEMGCIWFGTGNDAFFQYDSALARRKIENAFYYENPLDSRLSCPKLERGEIRILSVDVALMASTKSKKNDASAIIIDSLLPTSDNSYIHNIVFMETYEGLTTDELGIIIMRLYYGMHCSAISLDTNGIGTGCFDFLTKSQYDPVTGQNFSGLSCANDPMMAQRCKIPGAAKAIWSIKANANFNTEMYILLRSSILQGKINFLVSEQEADDKFRRKNKSYSKLSTQTQVLAKLPYVQTSLMINELVSLEHKVVGTNIKISERSGMRKDRVSALGMAVWTGTQIERNMRPREATSNLLDCFAIKSNKSFKQF